MRKMENARMEKTFKLPKLSDKDIAELTLACRMAFGNPEADEFLDRAMAGAEHYRQLRFEFDQQTRVE
jgi:hypothetical protein